MTKDTPRLAAAGGKGASPQAAAAFAAATIAMWTECALRLWFAHGGDAVLRLWSARAGDIAAFWLAISLAAVLAYAALALLWRGRATVGTIPAWTCVLTASAVVAPLLGEWGQALGI